MPESGLLPSAMPARRSSLAAALLLQNPASPPHWLRLSRLLWMEQQPEKAALCLEQAVALAPYSPPVLLEAAALFHASGRGARGLDLMSRALAATRDYDGVIFALYGRAADVAAVLRQGLPRDPAAARAYLLHLIEARDRDGARLAWDWLLRSHFADRAILRRYLRYLIEDGLSERAAAAFTDFLPPEERPTGGNRVTHGGFEASSTGTPLDWTVTPSPHAQARRDDSSAHQGRWSLRIEFDGAANIAYRHVAQQAVVAPGRWKLQAWIRAGQVTSGQGVGLRIFEARPTPAWQVWTETVSGNSDWKRIEAVVTVPPAVRLVQIEIVRRSSNKLDNRMGGVVWIDSVSLTPSDDSR
jgi:tetratricopeptide (TPR) repeat protein